MFVKRTVAATGALVEKNEGGRLGHWKDLKMVLIRKIRCRDHLYYMDSGALHAMEGSLRILHCPLVNHPRRPGLAMLNPIRLNLDRESPNQGPFMNI